MQRTLHIRADEIQRTDEGLTFPMVLATEGEASDGDILSIRGGSIPDRMPLLISHWNDPAGTAGSVTQPRKNLRASPPELLAVGTVELGGSGAQKEAREDLAHMIESGHVDAVSIRWEPGKFTRRVNLPKDHPAAVREDEGDYRKRYGLFHEEWRALEGSVVAIGADPAAVMAAGRSEGWEGFLRSADIEDFAARQRLDELMGLLERQSTERTEAPSEPDAPEPAIVTPAPARVRRDLLTVDDLERIFKERDKRLHDEMMSLIDHWTGKVK